RGWSGPAAGLWRAPPERAPAPAAGGGSGEGAGARATIWRTAAPPRAPAVMPSMSRPASLNMPFCSATAQGSVATRRPYWLTVIFAAQAGVTAKVITAVAGAARNHMGVSPVYGCVHRRDGCGRKPCTLGFQPPARSPRAAAKERDRRNPMRIVHGDQIEEKIRIHQHRQGMFRYRTVAAGEPGTPGNFILEMVRTTDD